MINYLIRRLLIGAVTLVLITFLVYALIRNMPGTPLTVVQAAADPSMQLSEADMKRLERAYGLDKPWPLGYMEWAGKAMWLDLGNSLSRKEPVVRLIRQRVGATLVLTVSSLILSYLLSIPLGLWSTARSNTTAERSVSLLLYMLYSLPSFVAALYLQILFAVKLEILPLRGIVSMDYAEMTTFGKVWDIFLHSLLPIVCFTYGSLAYYSRFIKSNMQEVIRQDYIRTAKAKGLSEWAVLVKHAFRNTMIPLVTLVGLTLPSLLGGAIILEMIFDWPGMGRLFFESLSERDYPTIMGLTLMFSVLTLVGQLLADVLYSVVDPRVTYN
ncbi:ABC transporter permease [Aeoliella mucimassa]|uniref:Dipeptide transport system permease protein DppB n=1 Tax=Aeoliella mucimassa TaxID=2527972 RepID=A0A518AHZ6_9BACT|nr:ABC transporter permease [Aeoliella mucimassa]QDU54294.1 Dipeptide transport system permease protein DppB [Aeoliella mucimassa]